MSPYALVAIAVLVCFVGAIKDRSRSKTVDNIFVLVVLSVCVVLVLAGGPVILRDIFGHEGRTGLLTGMLVIIVFCVVPIAVGVPIGAAIHRSLQRKKENGTGGVDLMS